MGVRILLGLFLSGNLLIGSQSGFLVGTSSEEGVFNPYEDRRVTEADELVAGLSSPNCAMRWEAVKGALTSWEQSLFLYREIDKRIGSYSRDVNDRLLMIRQFIDDEGDAAIYLEELAGKVNLARSERAEDLLHITQEIESVIAERSDKVVKKLLALDLLVTMGIQSKPMELLQSNEASDRYAASVAIVMRKGFLVLDDDLQRRIVNSIIWGIIRDSFAVRYFAQRSLEELSKPLAPSFCVDPTDFPNADNVKKWEYWWQKNHAAVFSSLKERQKADRTEVEPK